MHWTHRTYEEKKEERPPRSVVRQTGLTWTQKMRITPSKLFFGTIQISCQHPLLVPGSRTQLNSTTPLGVPHLATNADIIYE